jgi:hypothetical protein
MVGLPKKSLDDYYYQLRLGEKYEFDFIETSAKNNSNVSSLFGMINENVYTQYKDDLSLKRRSKKRSFNIELKVFDIVNNDNDETMMKKKGG